MPIEPLLLPLFWPIAALYLGGMASVKGGSPGRELIGLLVSFVVWVVLWWGLGKLLSGIGPVFGQVILPTAIAMVATPFILTIVFRLLGIRIQRERAGVH